MGLPEAAKNSLHKSSKRVCVIGAGPSGLVAARELIQEGHIVVVMEQNKEVGGQWLYSEHSTQECSSVHSSVYSSLRVVSPRETMGFTDFPFVTIKGRDGRRFPGHHELLLYLRDFCHWFGLWEFIRLKTKVEAVFMASKKDPENEALKWVVRSSEEGRKMTFKEEVYDAVVVATGHYTHPRLPSIKGMDGWKGMQLHSHAYRVPEPFRNHVVVVVGSSLSGQDITMELVYVACHVYLSARSILSISEGFSKAISRHGNLHLRPKIESMNGDGRVDFVDGSWVNADSVIYCTGYSYNFPFLDTKGIVTVDDDRVGPLYEHTFPPSLAPSLSFIGIPKKIIGFPFFETQAKWIAQLLSGKRSLPPWEEMMKSIQEFYHSRAACGVPKHQTHDIADFEYCDRYADHAGVPRLEEWRKELCLWALQNSETDWENYRDIIPNFEFFQFRI